jgi:pyruvate ferredoxin oxidoreductase gamma subunit
VFQIRFHGRGGQGVVTAAELLAIAAFRDGLDAQAFPVFGSERTGAPVMAFCRVDDHEIRTHEPITHPDALVIQDATLLHAVDVFAGFTDGPVLINTSRDLDVPGRLIKVPASELAREHLGRPMPGAPLLGALAAATGVVSFGALEQAIRERFAGAVADGNVAAARAAYEAVVAHA